MSKRHKVRIFSTRFMAIYPTNMMHAKYNSYETLISLTHECNEN